MFAGAPVTIACACSWLACWIAARSLLRRPSRTMASRSRLGSPGGHPQIAVGRPRVIETLILAIDQDRGRRIGLDSSRLRQIASADAPRGCRVRGSRPIAARARRRRADRKIDFAGPAAADLPVDPLRLGDRLEAIVETAHRLGAAENENAALAQREMEQREEPSPAPQGADRSAGCGTRSDRGARTADRPAHPEP